MSALEYVKTLELGDGDVVVMRFGDRVGTFALDAIKRELSRALGDRTVLVCSPGYELGALPDVTVEALRRAIAAAGGLGLDERGALEQLLEVLEGEPDG